MKRGFVLFASIFLVLFLGIFLGIAFLRSNVQLDAMDARVATTYAFYAAESGVDDAINFLRGNLGFTGPLYNGERVPLIWPLTGRTIGFYAVNVVQDSGNPTVFWIRSEGHHNEQARIQRFGPTSGRRVIFARVTQESPTNFFTSTISDLRINSGANIGGDILARDVTFNVNTALPPGQRQITVNADVEYMRNISNYPNPDVTVNGQVAQRPPITFAGVDLNRYRNLADPALGGNGRYIPANQAPFGISGDIDWPNLGTNNGLVFVEGDVRISGRVAQSIHIVSAGDIYIEDDLSCPIGAGGIAPQIGLSAFDDVFIPVNAPDALNIDAYIVANGGIFRADGVVGSKGTLNFSGAMSVRGKATAATAVALNVYSNRNLNYNTALGNAVTVPFLSFMVNINYWREVEDPDAAFPPQPPY